MTEPKILYGGQAVIEGVMMRGRNFVTCAARRENGEIVLKSEEIPRGIYSGVWSKTPFLRALPLLWDTLVLGTRMLMWAANIQAADEIAKEKASEKVSVRQQEVNALENEETTEALVAGATGSVEGAAPEVGSTHELRGPEGANGKSSRGDQVVRSGGQEVRSDPDGVHTASPNGKGAPGQVPNPNGKSSSAQSDQPEGLSQPAIYASLAISLGLGLAIFFALPVVVANFLGNFGVTPFWNNIAEGLIRLGLFLAYLLAIGRVPEIQRVFMYHGAEHKTIAAFEGGARLIPAEIQKFSKEHPRCGTGFLLTVVVISIVFFVLLGDLPLGLRLLSRIVLIPFVAAVSYELIRFASQHRNIFIFDWLVVRPSLALQSLTTRQPTDEMIQVAVAAFEDVRKKEEAALAQPAT